AGLLMASSETYETLALSSSPDAPGVLEVAINRPDSLNAFNGLFWVEMKRCMEAASDDPEVRCVVLHGGSCRLFTSGLDLKEEMSGGSGGTLGIGAAATTKADVSRRALRMEAGIRIAQDGISSVERCRKPVVVAMHSGVIGGGVDLVCACDIRYCSEDTFFSIAEVNVGLTAD
ncbi:unnamed protein product, partial [Polarella glacialis]